MKKLLLIILVFMLVSNARAQHMKGFKYYTIKTDLFNPFNLGIEVPVGAMGSLDLNARTISSYIFEDMTKFNIRLFYKNHFKRSLLKNNYQSTYLLAGIHYAEWSMSNYPKQDNSREYGELSAGYIALGAGKRFKMIDLWISTDFMVAPFDNRYGYVGPYDPSSHRTAWKPPVTVFIGCSFDFINVRL